jgi:hypothetical protein
MRWMEFKIQSKERCQQVMVEGLGLVVLDEQGEAIIEMVNKPEIQGFKVSKIMKGKGGKG